MKKFVNRERCAIVFTMAMALAAGMEGRLFPQAGPVESGIRVGLSLEPPLSVGPGHFRVVNGTDRSRLPELTLVSKLSVGPSADGVVIGNRNLGRRAILEPSDPGRFVAVNGRPYRGRVEFTWNGSGRLTVVNELSLDDYVQGILVHEASPAWPEEALKVQAVVSRTYALKNRGRHNKEGYDVCDRPHCQVYGGQSSERPVTNRAVEETRKEVVLYKGELISAVFHSCCGGSTEDSSNIWEGPGVPYLKAVRCGWCRKSPHYRWSARIRPDEIARRLKTAGYDVGRLSLLRILSRSRSGRVYEVRLRGSQKEVRMRGNQFRDSVDDRVIRSTLWTALLEKPDSWRFDGRGWGHGVGLCQWGAKAMADRGRNYKEILRFYYKNTTVAKLKT